jgi:phenylacetate 2-hydroxylase
MHAPTERLQFLVSLYIMAIQTLAVAVITVVYFVIRYFNRTDIPKIKGLPEIPGIPIFGNLLQLGDQHATVTGKWAKKFGPVFQVRMGNKVSNQISFESDILRI